MTSPFRRVQAAMPLAAAVVLTALSAIPSKAMSIDVYESPVAPVSVTRLASLPAKDWLPGHRGVDLSARVGQPVTSPAAGIVTYVGVVVDRPIVSVRHRGGLVSSLEPVEATVHVGDTVATGDPVGTVSGARSHCSPATCVHWGLRLAGVYANPLDYLHGFGPVRLLPLDP